MSEISPRHPALKITGTYLDEISHDIPHQNWGVKEWDRDFSSMKAMGIDTVIVIRSGHRRWMTFPSKVLTEKMGGYIPPADLIDMFLTLAEKYGMKFFFGTYDSGQYWSSGEYQKEVDINLEFLDEVWARYGRRKAFAGWYLTQEVSRNKAGVIGLLARIGSHCKALSNGLPTLISPWIDGKKAVWAFDSALSKKQGITLSEHERDWNEILSVLKGSVDYIAFQDGHCDYDELSDFLVLNRQLAEKYGMQSWTNCESFDRDMPIKFLPIKWEKMLLKLRAAADAGLIKGITFEFSHFMSPNSMYASAGNLYNRYCEYFGIRQ